jgi:hypothetical protein
LGPLPLASFRTAIIDHRYTWALRGPTYYCNPAGCSNIMMHPLICERKLVQPTSLSHTLWLTVIYGARITADIGY